MIGTYVIKSQGKVLSVANNVVTQEGQKEIQRFLAGQRNRLAATIGLGVGSKPTSVSDTSLNFEVTRAPVSLVSPDFTNNTIVMKGTLPQNVSGKFYEIGLWSNQSLTVNNEFLVTFDNTVETWSTGVHSESNTRLGRQTLLIESNTNSTSTTSYSSNRDLTNIDLNKDKMTLAVFVGDNNLNSISVRFRLDAANYFSKTFTSLSSGYQLLEFTRSEMTKTGTVEWNAIKAVAFEVKSNTTNAANSPYTGTKVYLDGLVLKRSVSNEENNVLVSRALLAGIPKTIEAEMELEYYLGIRVNG